MLRIHRAELRSAWPAWLGVCLTFVVVNAALAVPALVLASGVSAVANGLDLMASAVYTAIPVILAVMVCFVAFPVIASSTRLVVDSRRGALARLALAGATPGQVSGLVRGQLVAVCLACAVAGDAIAAALVRPVLDLFDHVQRNEPLHVSIPAVVSPLALVVANLACVLVALVAGAGQASLASRIPPVEALRQSQAPVPVPGLRAGGRVAAALLLLLGVGSFASIPAQVAARYAETVSNLIVLGALQPFLWGALLAVLAPVVVGPVTAAWTGLVRSDEPAWVLARSTVAARPDRLHRSVVPVLFCVGIAVSDLGVTGSLAATVPADVAGTSSGDLAGFALVFGLPLAVAFAGAIGSLLMMARQRDAELALLGVAGATPTLRVQVPALESLVITGTATLLSLGMVLPAYLFQAWSLSAVGLGYVPVLPWLEALAVVAGCLVVMAAATVLPTLAAQREPEPRVVARLVAE